MFYFILKYIKNYFDFVQKTCYNYFDFVQIITGEYIYNQ